MKRKIKTHPLIELKKKFNSLTSREKWKHYKTFGTGPWFCGGCGEVVANGVQAASPFSGCSVHCGNCDYQLTRRTGGGQNDPFGWILDDTSLVAKSKTKEWPLCPECGKVRYNPNNDPQVCVNCYM